MGRVRLAGQSPSLDLRQRLAAAEERIGEQAMQIKSIFDYMNYHRDQHLKDNVVEQALDVNVIHEQARVMRQALARIEDIIKEEDQG
jgi:hypothetical protein